MAEPRIAISAGGEGDIVARCECGARVWQGAELDWTQLQHLVRRHVEVAHPDVRL